MSGKRIRHELHSATLCVYLEAGVPPKGLYLSHPPAMNDLNSEDRREWQSALSNASLKLVGLTISHCDKTCLKEQEKNTLKSNIFTPRELKDRRDFEVKLREELISLKAKKLTRDNVTFDLELFRMNTEVESEIVTNRGLGLGLWPMWFMMT